MGPLLCPWKVAGRGQEGKPEVDRHGDLTGSGSGYLLKPGTCSFPSKKLQKNRRGGWEEGIKQNFPFKGSSALRRPLCNSCLWSVSLAEDRYLGWVRFSPEGDWLMYQRIEKWVFRLVRKGKRTVWKQAGVWGKDCAAAAAGSTEPYYS